MQLCIVKFNTYTRLILCFYKFKKKSNCCTYVKGRILGN